MWFGNMYVEQEPLSFIVVEVFVSEMVRNSIISLLVEPISRYSHHLSLLPVSGPFKHAGRVTFSSFFGRDFAFPFLPP